MKRPRSLFAVLAILAFASAADALSLPVIDEITAGDPSGRNRRSLKITEAGTLAVGGVTFNKVRLAVRELPKLANGAQIEGVLGIGLFQDHLLTLDYPARRVRIEKGELPADGKETVAFETPFGIPQIRLSIGDLEVETQIDSGNMKSGLTLPASYIGKVPLESEPKVVGKAQTGFNEFEIQQAPLKGAVKLGSQTVAWPHVDFVELFPHANIGHAFLSRFVVTVDQKNQRIQFKA